MQETPLGGLSLLLEHQFGGIFCFPAALTLGPALACVPGVTVMTLVRAMGSCDRCPALRPGTVRVQFLHRSLMEAEGGLVGPCTDTSRGLSWMDEE